MRLRNAENKVISFFKESAESKEIRIKFGKQLQDINDSINWLEKKNSIAMRKKRKDEIVKNLQNSKINMEKQMEKLEHKIDRQEQYTRRNSIFSQGIPESPNENAGNVVMQTMTEHLDINVTENDLDQSHRYRLGKRSTSHDKSRPIIMILVKYNIRKKIFYSKKKLKGKKTSTTESLTKIRMKTLKKARQEFGVCNVWSSDGPS